MAINYGGPPSTIYVMPIVFGCAPVVSTFTSMYFNKTLDQISPFFAAGLILVAAGAVTILITAPRPKPAPKGATTAKAIAPAKPSPVPAEKDKASETKPTTEEAQ